MGREEKQSSRPWLKNPHEPLSEGTKPGSLLSKRWLKVFFFGGGEAVGLRFT